MTFSLTSFFSGLCSVTLFIMCFGFILRHKKAYKYFRTDALLLIICLIFIRLLFPFEHKHMIYIPIQKVMNPLLDFFNQIYIVKLSKAFDLIMAYGKCSLFDLLHKRLYSYRIYLQKNNEAKSNCWI